MGTVRVCETVFFYLKKNHTLELKYCFVQMILLDAFENYFKHWIHTWVVYKVQLMGVVH